MNTDKMVTWTSEEIDISAYSDVDISIKVGSNSKVDKGEDYIYVYYKLDGNESVLRKYDGKINNAITIEESGISGQKLQIIIRTYTDSDDEYYYFDDVSVTS
jgi:hypothetical protein